MLILVSFLIKHPFLILLCMLLGSFLWVFADSIYHFSISPKNYNSPIVFKESGFFDKVFVQLPRQIGLDRSRFDRNNFQNYGIICFTGVQGSGKTISMMHFASKLKAMYPKCKVLSNTDCIFADDNLDNWQKLLKYKNGLYGVVCLYDEISLHFHSRNYKNADPQFLRLICQNRKERRCILCSAQYLSMVDKQIRLQITEERKCFTFFGCLTFVLRFQPVFESESGALKKNKFKGFYFFVQSDFLRECYDTYKVIDTLGKIGFQDRKDLLDYEYK